ncbi:MAG: hypothetical protein HYX63_08660 [Gammaproteobacteria bacterium]|nr:hypothetical protein [Gammaproteobacteria bacterium]
MKPTMAGLILLALGALCVGAEQNLDPQAMTPREFDCVDTFNSLAGFVMLRCSLIAPEPRDARLLDAAKRVLLDHRFAQSRDFADLNLSFCPLLRGTGMVPAANRIYLDDGLRGSSAEGLAEVLAHEAVHVRQLNTLGERDFKCRYVAQMSACGGCQDRRHPLEAEAYAAQDLVRNTLLRAHGITPPPAPK